MDENPYEAPQAASERPPENSARERRVRWGMVLVALGVLWIGMVATIGVPINAVDPKVRVSNAEWFAFFIITSCPAAMLFWLAWRARR
jgi:hypothetical protein